MAVNEIVLNAGGVDGPLFLESIGENQVEVVGTKAARLARLSGAGFNVPAGAVLSVGLCARRDRSEIRRAVEEVVAVLGPGPFAVRSSAAEEDLDGVSYAGMYETVLDVTGVDHIVEATLTVIASALSARVEAYDEERPHRMATLIQRMVAADSAGVAFSADPITGDRGLAAVMAIRGVGERLVSGESTGERWTVADGSVRGPSEPSVLTEPRARVVADLVREVERIEGLPQDIEWAFEGDSLYLLQARPMTALPPVVSWDPPGGRGYYRSDFRIGEWLHGPVTPLFRSWFLPRYDAALDQAFRRYLGLSYRLPMHATINGWYFGGMEMEPIAFLRMLRRPQRALRYFRGFGKIGRDPTVLDRDMAAPALAWYRSTLEPEITHTLAAALRDVAAAGPDRLLEIVDDLSTTAGLAAFGMVVPVGAAWKIEYGLATFCRAHLSGELGDGYEVLLAGLIEPRAIAPHAVSTFDWAEPTFGEIGIEPVVRSPERFERLRSERTQAEARCRAALGGDPKLLDRFDRFLEVTQRYAVLREELVHELTAGWPVIRSAIQRLGAVAVERGVIADVDDVFHLLRSELAAVVAGTAERLDEVVGERKEALAAQRRLVPPTSIGEPNANWKFALKAIDRFSALRSEGTAPVAGVGASPGRATGTVRVVGGPRDFDLVRDGDVLVARTTAPAWTPLFNRISAIVTDSGSVAAHASLIAREYGIPAVVGTTNATTLLKPGMTVVVDGRKGTVEIVGE